MAGFSQSCIRIEADAVAKRSVGKHRPSGLALEIEIGAVKVRARFRAMAEISGASENAEDAGKTPVPSVGWKRLLTGGPDDVEDFGFTEGVDREDVIDLSARPA